MVCALFKGTTKAYILDRKELVGNLLENVEDALIFLKKYLQFRWEITSKSTRRKETLELPEIALREAMVNAVCHRDCLEQGAQVMVEIFDDRVEIYNPGGLPKGLPEKDFGKRSVCRNSNIASLLLRCDYIEKMGSGIERIHAALEKENCPHVKIDYHTMFSLVFLRPTYITNPALGENREKLLALILENPAITSSQLAEQTSLTQNGIEWQIVQLKKQGNLERIGPDRGGHWKVIKD
ncbi:MAG: winged helix-turn-helix transcriptional regulator [Desulfobacterales bacterium]|nr:winged helix-turn-helix transcriptional regulator [Desulfobacterales bacterium]